MRLIHYICIWVAIVGLMVCIFANALSISQVAEGVSFNTKSINLLHHAQ